MAKISGHKQHLGRLKKLGSPDFHRKIAGALYAGGQLIELEAERSITEGSISGKNHVPSRPGEPPNADTRLLDTNIETTIESDDKNISVAVTSHAPYSAFLEFGTSKMVERPFMRPAVAKKKDEAVALITKVIKRALK